MSNIFLDILKNKPHHSNDILTAEQIKLSFDKTKDLQIISVTKYELDC